VVHQEFKHHLPLNEKHEPWRRIMGWFITINFVCLCWILFRSPNFATAILMGKRYLLIDRGGSETIPAWLALLGPGLLLCQLAMRRFRFEVHACALSLNQFAIAYGATWAVALSMLPLGYRPFIYFQF